MKIDIFAHIMPQEYFQAFGKANKRILDSVEARAKAVTDVKYRLLLMERYPDVLQLLTVSNPPLDVFVDPDQAAKLAPLANDGLAELVDTYPNRFLGAIAHLPMNNLDAALEETDRAITKLRFKGIQIATRVNKEWIDLAKYKPLWAKMVKYNLPIWIHPYTNEKMEPDGGRLSWPYDTAMTMDRIVSSGIFDEFPSIKFITHHAGSMISFFGNRVGRPDQFKKFYNDTAVYGNTAALMCAYAYWGADHLLFGTDMPLGPKNGLTWQTMASVERMSISQEEKDKIFVHNAVSLCGLSL